MKIPEFLYGSYQDVRKKCRTKARDFFGGMAIDDLADGKWLDTGSTGGALVLEGPARLFAQGGHFHCFALMRIVIEDIVRGRLGAEAWHRLYEASLPKTWSFLGLLGQDAGVFLYREPGLWRGFLQAAVNYWPDLEAEGERYTQGLPPSDLWSLPTNIGFVLVRLGVPKERLRLPVPPGGLAAVVADATTGG
jgi:hypothetical protein